MSGPRTPPGGVPTRAGVTLLELLVVLVVLAVMAGVSGAAFVRRLPPPTWRDTAAETVARARTTAVGSGRAVPFTVDTPEGAVRGTALPDGSVLAAPVLAIERLTGRPREIRAAPVRVTAEERAGGRRAGQL